MEMRYSDEFRHRVAAEVLAPRNRTVVEVCREHGISACSLHRWKKAGKSGTLDRGAMKPGERLADDQRGEWLRGRGLHSEHLSLYVQEIHEVMTEKEKRTLELIP